MGSPTLLSKFNKMRNAEVEVIEYETFDFRETIIGLSNFLWSSFWYVSLFCCRKTRDLVCGPPDTSVVKGKTPLLKIMNRLEVTENEAAKFFDLFEKIDKDHSGAIEINEFFTYFKLEHTEFAERAFMIMDFEGGHVETEKEKLKREKGKEKLRRKSSMKAKSKSKKKNEPTAEELAAKAGNKSRNTGDGSLNYPEFFISLWNFCTLTHNTLVKFTFDLYDIDGSGELSIDEVFAMVRTIHPQGSKDQGRAEAKKLMVLMDKTDEDGFVTFEEFLGAHRKLGTVIYPAFMLQRSIRARAMSNRFWKKATKKRETMFGTGPTSGTVDDLINLYRELCKEKETYQIDEAVVDDAEQDSDEEARLLKELDELKKAKEEERKKWAMNAKLEFMDAKHLKHHEEGNTPNGLMLAMAASRLHSKIYHSPREGSWWAENPDVKGPRPAGVRPHSAKFTRDKKYVFDEDPAIVVDRGIADMMTEVDRARLRGKRGLTRAKRTKNSAQRGRKAVDESGSWASVRKPKFWMRPFSAGGRKTYDVDMSEAQKLFMKQARKFERGAINAKRIENPAGEDSGDAEDLEAMEEGNVISSMLGRGVEAKKRPGSAEARARATMIRLSNADGSPERPPFLVSGGNQREGDRKGRFAKSKIPRPATAPRERPKVIGGLRALGDFSEGLKGFSDVKLDLIKQVNSDLIKKMSPKSALSTVGGFVDLKPGLPKPRPKSALPRSS